MASHFYLRPIAALLLSLMGGIVLGCQFPGHAIVTLGFVFLAAGFIGINLFRKKPVGLSPIFLYIALGYVAVQPWVAPHYSPNHIQNFSDDTRWQIAGVVDSHPVQFSYLKRFVLRADTLKHKEASYRVTGRIRVTVSGKGPGFARGDRVVFRSRLRQPRNFNNPGGFNYRRYMAFKGLWRTAYTKGSRLQVVQKASSGDAAQQLQGARRALAALIDRADKGPSAAVLKALVIGDRSAISSEVRDEFNRAGVGHVLAISGLHIGIVATVAFFFFHKLLRLVRPLLWRAWTRKGAAILSLVPVCIYGLVSGMSPSTQRAVIMVGAFLMTFLFERERDTLNTLALAAFIILIWFPPALFSISFQLSFMAVLSILYGLACIQKAAPIVGQSDPTGFAYQLRRKLVGFFWVSLLAICGTLPLVMFYFNQISLVGLFANFVIVPPVGFVVIPCGLLTLFIYPVSSQIAYGCVQICLFVLEYVLMAINYFADLPFAAVKTITPSLFEMVCYYVLGWVTLNWLNTRLALTGYRDLPTSRADCATPQGRNSKSHGSFGLNRLLSRAAAAGRFLTAGFAARKGAIIGLVVVLALLVDAGYWFARRNFNGHLRVTYIDVGQGSSALLELPGGHTALIDGGGFSDNNTFDMGARVLAPFLWRKKIRTIDTLVLSHPNSDHLNGLIFIARHFNVKTIWTNNETRATQGYKRLQNIIAQEQISLPDFQHMPRQQWINGVEFRFLYPPADFLTRKASQKWRSLNNNSLVVKVSYGNISFLFAGDIMAKAEQELVELAAAHLGCDVLLVPHHGSRTSSSPPFLSSVQPDIAVFSAGGKNRFRLPHPAVLAAYEKIGSRIFRTDQNGAIMVKTDGNRLTVEPFLRLDNAP